LLPENVKSRVIAAKKEVEELPMKCKFVEDENLHICFSFLGEISESDIKSISEKLDDISKGFRSFDVEISEVKIIPNEKYIRVLALEVFDKNGILSNLSGVVQKEIGGDGKPPHITLCRVKSVANKPVVVERIKSINKTTVNFSIDRLQLIKSELKKTGPVYSVAYESKFNA
jgi:2'-5' RNA ligase